MAGAPSLQLADQRVEKPTELSGRAASTQWSTLSIGAGQGFFLFHSEIAFAISLAITAWPKESPPSFVGTR